MPTFSPASVTVVTVSFNSAKILPKMLSSLPTETPVVIVDNNGNDTDELTQLASDHGAVLITNQTNRGFGVACNIGAEISGTEYLLFLNPDAHLEDGCLEALLEAARNNPDVGALVPNVHDGRGRPAFRRRSRLLSKHESWSGSAPNADQTVPLLNGAAVFVKRTNFEAVGGFDEGIFLFHEDDDLSLRIAKECGPLYFVHNAIVSHSEGESTARSPAVAAFKARHMAQSALYTMRKHNRPFALLRVLVHALLQMISPLNLFSARKRAKNFGFLMGTLSANKFRLQGMDSKT